MNILLIGDIRLARLISNINRKQIQLMNFAVNTVIIKGSFDYFLEKSPCQ